MYRIITGLNRQSTNQRVGYTLLRNNQKLRTELNKLSKYLLVKISRKNHKKVTKLTQATWK